MRLEKRISRHLPALRRFAQAATGNRSQGDEAVGRLIEHLVGTRPQAAAETDRISLYRILVRCLDGLRRLEPPPQSPLSVRALLCLDLLPRLAFLLTALEGFTEREARSVLGLASDAFRRELDCARDVLGRLIATDVVIIKDEFFISRDLASIVTSLGHRVIARPRTRDEAGRAMGACTPGLILADVHLADDTSGIDAVADVLCDHQVSVIFITAYPNRLLAAWRPEPTYFIAKPYRVDEVKAVINQSLFFGHRARLVADAGADDAASVPADGVHREPRTTGEA